MKNQFTEELRKAKEAKISPFDLNIAVTCQDIFNFKYTDNQFNRLCNVVKNAYLQSDELAVYEIAGAINIYITNEKHQIQTVLRMSIDRVIQLAL